MSVKRLLYLLDRRAKKVRDERLYGTLGRLNADGTVTVNGSRAGWVIVNMGNGVYTELPNTGSGHVPVRANLPVKMLRLHSGDLVLDGQDDRLLEGDAGGPGDYGVPPHAPTHTHGGSDPVGTTTPAPFAIVEADADGFIGSGWLDPADLSSGAVTSVNGQTGVVVLDSDDITEGATNLYMTAAEASKLAGIAAGAEVNVNADWTASSGDAFILNKPTIPTLPVKATGAEIDTGTDDAKFATPKAIEDSSYIKAAYADAKVTDAIADGVTTVAPSQNAVFDALALKIATSVLDTDVTLAANSDAKIPSQKAIKTYVDAIAQGLDIKGSVRVATTANITLSGTQTIDGVAVIAGERVLVKDQTLGANNGIYVVAAGAWTRATDADVSAEVTAGMFAFVSEGTVNGDNGFALTTNDPIVLGTTVLVFTQVSGAGQIVAGNALTKTGNQLDWVPDGATLEVASDQGRIKDKGVTYAKIQDVSATDKLLGRATAGAGVVEEIPLTATGRSIIAASTIALAQAALNLTPGTNVQAYDATLLSIALLGTAADRMLYTTGVDTWAELTTTSYGRSLLSAANIAAAITALALNSGGASDIWVKRAGDTMTGVLDMGSHKITSVTDPTAAQDVATKAYVDAVAQGLDAKQSVRVATTANIALTGTQTIDGVAVIAGDRVLVKDQTLGANNGIYVVAAGAWTRAIDADISAEVTSGMYTFVTEGTANGNVGFALITDDPIVLATTVLTFTAFNGGVNVGAAVDAATDLPTPTGVTKFAAVLAGVLRTVTWTNIVATLTAAFNSLYAVLLGTAGGQTLHGGTAANEDLTLRGTANATKTTSYVIIQDTGGAVVIGDSAPDSGTTLHIKGASTPLKAERTTAATTLQRAAASLRATTTGSAADGFGPAFFFELNDAETGAVTNIIGQIGAVRAGADTNGDIVIIAINGGAAVEVMRLTHDGLVGIGVTVPQGAHHVHDGVGGMMFVTKSAVAGTKVVIIANGTGDVLSSVTCTYALANSDGSKIGGVINVPLSGSVPVTVGGTTWTFSVAANGEFSVIRTAGTDTAIIAMQLVWR